MTAVRYQMLDLEDGSGVIVAETGSAGGPIVVALPGFKGSDRGLRGLCSDLANRGCHVWTINFPGLGVTATNPGRSDSLEDLVNLTRGVIDSLAVKGGSTVLVGHSFGATVAACVAARSEPGIEHLILLSPVVFHPDKRRGLLTIVHRTLTRAMPGILRSWPSPLTQGFVRSFIVDLLINSFSARRGIRGLMRIVRASASERAIVGEVDAIASQLAVANLYGCSDFAQQILVRTDIVAGDRDQMSSVAELDFLRREIPDANLWLLRGAGHLAHHEDASHFNRTVLDAVFSEKLTGKDPG